MKNFRQLTLYSLAALFFVAVGFVLAMSFVPQNSVSAIGEGTSPATTGGIPLTEQEKIYEKIYDMVAPSVVSIVIETRRNEDTFWTPVGSGSGFVIDEQGHIVTNYHVIASSDDVNQNSEETVEGRISVSLFDGTIVAAEVIGRDPQSDLAVIQVDVSPNSLHPIAFGDSEALHEGQFVFAIGNPFSNDWTLTSGIVSALNRSIPA